MIDRQQDNLPARRTLPPGTVISDIPLERESDGMDLHEYLAVLFRRRWVMVVTLAVVFTAGMIYTFTRRPIYESVAKIVVVTSRGSAPVSADDMPILSDLQALKASRSVDTQVEVISSPDLLEEAFKSLSPDMRARGFRSGTLPGWAHKITSKKDTDVISVVGRAYSPAAAAALANTIADTYFKRDLKHNSQATRQAREYAEKEMISVGRGLADASAELARFKQNTGLFAPDAQLTKAADQMAQLSLDLHAAKTEVASIQCEISAFRQELAREQQDVVANTTVTQNPQFNAIREKIDTLNSERTTLLQEFTPESREVKAMEERIGQEERRLKHVAETIVGSKVRARNPIRDTLLTKYATSVATLSATTARIQALENELRSRKQAARGLPERERGLADRIQHAALLQRRYEILSNSYYNLLLSEQATIPNGMLVSRAGIPAAPAYPNPSTSAVFFLLLGTVLALIAGVVSERLDSRLHDQYTTEQMSGLTTLSVVPEVSHNSPQLPGDANQGGPLLESFRILRNNISFSGTSRPPRILAITSPGRGEGKSTTSVNLAVAMAMEGKRVLLVDGDIRRPSLHRFLAVPRHVGLTTAVTGTTTWEEAIVSTNIENVFCMPSGPACPAPAEMMNSQASRDLFKKMAEQFDIVLIDCPPTTGLSDVQVISTLADGVLLVVSMNQTLKPQLDITIRMLTQAGAPLVGLVINRMDAHCRGYGYYYHYCTGEMG